MAPVAIMAKRIRAAREALGLTQEQLAARARVHRSFVAKLEATRADPRVSVALRIAKALRVTLDDLTR